MSESYEIKVFDQYFTVVFGEILAILDSTRKVTTCTIVEMPSKKVYSGSSIKNPKDFNNIWEGRRYAFKRAVYFLWIIWTDSKRTGIPFGLFWQYFRKALGKNPIYLEERREKE